MRRSTTANFASKALLPLSAAMLLGLAACGDAEDTTVEPDVEDVSGGEMIVTEQTPAVPVDVPETEMTPVAPETPAATPTATPTPE